MICHFSIISYLNLSFIIAGFTVFLILYVFPRDNHRSNRILAIALLGIIWATVIQFLIETKVLLFVPHLIGTDGAATMISFPLMYLYVRSVALGVSVSKADILHATPLFLYLIDHLPFFTMSSVTKLALLENLLKGHSSAIIGRDTWLTPPSFYLYFCVLIMVFYWVLQFGILYRSYFKTPKPRDSGVRSPRIWLFYFWGVQVFAIAPCIFIAKDHEMQSFVAMSCGGVLILAMSGMLFLHPEILYGLHAGPVEDKKQVSPPTPTTNVLFQSAEDEELANKINEYMITSKKFLQHRYSITNLSADLQIPAHRLSSLLNQQLHISFNDFLNKFRIEYCMNRIKNGDAGRLTLEALSSESGFRNRNSFTAAFKRLTGRTPSEYMRQRNDLDN